MKIEEHEALKSELPRICYILGGKDNPLKIGEEFAIKGAFVIAAYIDKNGKLRGRDAFNNIVYLADRLEDIINHPEKIIRTPQFSEDEKALMRLCGENGYWDWYRDSNFNLRVREVDETVGASMCVISMKGITEQYTAENPFNAAEYLEEHDADN